jgi:hypothetical protein
MKVGLSLHWNLIYCQEQVNKDWWINIKGERGENEEQILWQVPQMVGRKDKFYLPGNELSATEEDPVVINKAIFFL